MATDALRQKFTAQMNRLAERGPSVPRPNESTNLRLLVHKLRTHRTGTPRWPRVLPVLFGALLLAAPCTARAANNCPWLNEATASAFIGRSATGAYAAASASSALCTFTENAVQPLRTLHISVETVSDAHSRYLAAARMACPSGPGPLPAVGNEASTCVLVRSGGGTEAKAVGRVRDQIFTITLATSVKNDAVLSPAMLGMKIDSAAEQVAGNLF